MSAMVSWISHLIAGAGSADFMAENMPFATAMIGCPHDSHFHAEGDPFTHTVMVAEELEAAGGFDDLEAERKEILRLGVWLHDIAKPATTIVAFDEELNRERVRQPGHAPLGAQMAWRGLIDGGYDAIRARDVVALVFWHQRPTHLLAQSLKGPQGNANTALQRVVQFCHETSFVNWDDLLRLCMADNLGRRLLGGIQPGTEALDQVRQYVKELGADAGFDLLNGKWTFPNAASRLSYLRDQSRSRDPLAVVPDPTGSKLIIVSGLPGSGREALIARQFGNLPVVCMDDADAELRMANGDFQGKLIEGALEEVRGHLSRGEDVVWKGACLTPRSRHRLVEMALQRDAMIELHSMDVPLAQALEVNGHRHAAPSDDALRAMAALRNPALASEAHELWTYDAHLHGRQLYCEGVASPRPANVLDCM